MSKTITQFYEESEKFIEIFNAFAVKHNLVGRAQTDHICYKCASGESFEAVRKIFETESLYVHQAIISNRRIAYIRFKQEIETVLGTIKYLELSDQRPDRSQKEGFEHIEVFATAMSYEEMVAELGKTEQIIHVERPHHTTDNIEIGEGFLFVCTLGPLIEKIKSEEMN